MPRWTSSLHPRASDGKFQGKGGPLAKLRSRGRRNLARNMTAARRTAARLQSSNDRTHGKGTTKVAVRVERRGLLRRLTPVVVSSPTSSAAAEKLRQHQERAQARYRRADFAAARSTTGRS